MEPSKQVQLRLPKKLIEAIDEAAEPIYAGRNDYIRQAIVDKLMSHNDGLDAVNIMMSDKRLQQILHALTRERVRRGQLRYEKSALKLYRDRANC